MRSFIIPLALFTAAALGDSTHGTCGHQCVDDSACGGCDAAGKCSCPDGKKQFYETSCTCVSEPGQKPEQPASDIQDSTWPDQWTADVETWTYGDFTDKTAVAKGHFWYDANIGRTRADWTPYINGKNAHQVWVGATKDHPDSTYYVKSGWICLKFPIHDPGQKGALVGVEKPDWVAKCNDAGYAHFVAREQVRVGSEDHWVDHWSCRLDYEAVNQSITFQNWHSLGLGSIAKGLPLRVTGGNSAPNAQKGSPRLNTVWYTNFVTGANATTADDFKAPGGICIPVGKEEVKSFFGHDVTKLHVFSPDFHRRAHFLPHASPSKGDLVRAKRAKPGKAFTGNVFAAAMGKLNALLLQEKDLKTAPCGNMSLALLHDMQRLLFDARAPELDRIYRMKDDTRRMAHDSVSMLHATQAKHKESILEHPQHEDKMRDGVCHELVMWYIHHLSSSAREAIKEQLVLPLLPNVLHEQPATGASPTEHTMHSQYKAQASCAICHIDAAGEAVIV